MPNPYTSAIRITKELEEKAKEIKVKKEQCDSLEADIQKRLLELKKIGADIANVYAKFNQGKVLYDNKSYIECIPIYKEVLNSLKSVELAHLNNYDTDLNKMFDISKYFNIDLARYQAEYKSLLNAVSENFVESFKKIEALKSQCLQIIEENELKIVQDIIAKLDIFDTTEKGIFESRSDEILGLISKKETILAAEKLKKLDIDFREQSGEKYRALLLEISSLKKSIEFTKLTFDAAKTSQIEKEVESEYKKGNIEKAIVKLKDLRTLLKNQISEFFENILAITGTSIEEAKFIGVENAEELSSEINKIKNDFYEGAYFNSLVAIKRVMSQIEKMKFQRLYDEISKVKDILSKAKEDNIDITDSLNSLESAKGKLKDKNYMGTYDDIKNASQQIEKIINLRDKLIKELVETKDLFPKISTEGISLNIYEKELDSISNLIKSDPVKAEAQLTEFKNRLRRDLEDYALNLKSNLDETISVSKMYEIDLKNYAIELLDQLFENSDFIAYISSTKKIEALLIENIEKVINSKISETEKKIAKESQETALILTDSLAKIKELLNNHSYKEIYTIFKEIENELWNVKVKEYIDKLKSIESVVEQLSNDNFDVSQLKTQITIFKIELGQKNDNNIRQAYSDLKNILDKLMRDIIDQILAYSNTILIVLNKLGIDKDRTPLPQKISEIKDERKNANTEESLKKSLILRKQASEILENSESLFIDILYLKRRTRDIKTPDTGTLNIDFEIEKIKKEYSEFNFDGCKKQIEDISEKIDNVLSSLDIDSITKKIEDLYKISQTVGFGSGFENDVVVFKRLINEKKFKDAKTLAEKIFKENEQQIETFFSQSFLKIDQLIETLKNRYLRIPLSENILEDSKKYFLNREYSKSLETLKAYENKINNIKYVYDILEPDIKLIEQKIREARNLGLVVEGIEKEYENIKAQISAGIYTEAINKVKAILSSITALLNEAIDSILNTVREEINNAKARNVDIPIVEGLLANAEWNLKKGNDYESLKKGFEALDELGKTDLQGKMAKKTFLKVKNEIRQYSNLMGKGIIEQQNEIERLMHTEKYTECIDRSLKLLDLIQNTIFLISNIQKSLDRSKTLIAEARDLNIYVNDIMNTISEAKTSFLSFNYENSLILINRATDMLEKKISEYLFSKENEYQKLLKTYKKFANFEKIEDEVKGLEKINKEDTLAFNKKREELINIIKEDLEKLVAEKIASLENYILSEKKYEMFYPDLIDKVNSLKSNEKNLEYEYILFFLEESMKEFERKFYEYIFSFMNSTKAEIEKYKLFGIDLSDILIKVSELLIILEDTDFVKIMEETKNISSSLEARIREEIEKRMKSEFADLEFINTKNAKQLRELINAAFQGKDYIQVLKYLIDVESVINSYESLLKAAREKFEILKQKFMKIKIENKETYVFLNRANEIALLINNDPELAIERISELSEEIDRFIEAHNNIISINMEAISIIENILHAKLEITNNSPDDTLNIQIKISGMLYQSDAINIKSIKGKDKKEMESDFSIAKKSGELQFIISFTNLDKSYTSEINVPFNLEIDPGYTIKKATGNERCSYCKGKIFSGLDYAECETGDAVYHVQCAKRAGKCIICHREFNFDKIILPKISVTT
ncbi:MAG: hypothetical protein ACP5RY_01370 [Thermoplasmata archaeon]